MEMKTYIEMGANKAGNNKKLAQFLNQSETVLSDVKSGKRGLPIEVCIELADYINVDRLEVIAASNLVTQKDEKKRKILESCFTKAASIAAAALILGASSMTSSPAHAALSDNESRMNMYYVK